MPKISLIKSPMIPGQTTCWFTCETMYELYILKSSSQVSTYHSLGLWHKYIQMLQLGILYIVIIITFQNILINYS